MRQTHCVMFLFLAVLRVGYFLRVNSATLNCQESYTFSKKESFSINIETPSYPNKYGNNESCWWAFVIPAGLQFSMTCDSFEVHESDYFCIEDYYNYQAHCYQGKKFTKWQRFPFVFTPLDHQNFIKMKFRSNTESVANGFRCFLTANTAKQTPKFEQRSLNSKQRSPQYQPSKQMMGNRETNSPGSSGSYAPSVCSCGIPHMAQRIVGGKPAGVHEYPWQVGLITPGKKQPWCGGTIISHQHILTAAHCTHGLTVPDIDVLLGEHNTTDSTATIFKITKITDHPQFNINQMHYDYSILTLDHYFNFTLQMSPVCLPTDVLTTYSDKIAKVTGWGLMESGGQQSTTLLEVDLKVLTNHECTIHYSGDIKGDQVCASAPGKDACQGDSGGPMFLFENSRHTQIGVVSFGIGCANPDFPGVFSRVTHVKEWIKGNTDETQNSDCTWNYN